MDLSQKSKDLNRSKCQTLSDKVTGSINQENNEMESKPMAINVKASDYQRVLTNHLNSVSTALTGAGVKDESILDSAMKQAESQFRSDYNATGGKHEDFFDYECEMQLQVINDAIDVLNEMKPLGKCGVRVEVGTICKKVK